MSVGTAGICSVCWDSAHGLCHVSVSHCTMKDGNLDCGLFRIIQTALMWSAWRKWASSMSWTRANVRRKGRCASWVPQLLAVIAVVQCVIRVKCVWGCTKHWDNKWNSFLTSALLCSKSKPSVWFHSRSWYLYLKCGKAVTNASNEGSAVLHECGRCKEPQPLC